MAKIISMVSPVIPPITAELGKCWDQPNTDNWLIDEKSVIMSKRDFDKLAEYSLTNPTALYAGKCWKRHVENPRKGIDKWYLCFCTDVPDQPQYIDINVREILIAD